MQPFTFWRCDTCGEPVDVEHGYVIWPRYGDANFEFRIIHRKDCDDRRFTSSLPLSDFLGPDGLVKLTSMLSYGPVKHDGEIFRNQHPMPDFDAWVDFVRRVQIPHYEDVRLLYSQPEIQERMSDATESYPYLQETIADLMNSSD